MKRVIELRPEPGATATVNRARERGLDAVAVPLFEVEAVAWEPPEAASFDALLLTSANAVRLGGAALANLHGLPVYAVGEATVYAAREAGFDIRATGDSGIDRLLGSVEQDLKLVHLCGEDRREPADARQLITNIPVYRAKNLENPDLGAAKAVWRGCIRRARRAGLPSSCTSALRQRSRRSARRRPTLLDADGRSWNRPKVPTMMRC